MNKLSLKKTVCKARESKEKCISPVVAYCCSLTVQHNYYHLYPLIQSLHPSLLLTKQFHKVVKRFAASGVKQSSFPCTPTILNSAALQESNFDASLNNDFHIRKTVATSFFLCKLIKTPSKFMGKKKPRY